jgi:hypothetical protein
MSSPSGSSPPQSFAGLVCSITEPPVFSSMTLTKVRCPGGSGTTGTICAYGTATMGGPPLVAVWAKVYAPTDTPPNTHPASATKGTVSGNNWSFMMSQEVPVIAAACAPAQPPPTAANGLFAVWCTFQLGSGPQEQLPQPRLFGGICSTTSNCTGSGPGAALLAQATAGAPSALAVETAPRQYQVKGEGASGSLASLVNATWVLSLRPTGCGCACVWDNGGDGVRRPRVELCCDAIVATQWRLTLALNGHRIQYTRPASEWNPLSVNRLMKCGDGSGLPDTLTVMPV